MAYNRDEEKEEALNAITEGEVVCLGENSALFLPESRRLEEKGRNIQGSKRKKRERIEVGLEGEGDLLRKKSGTLKTRKDKSKGQELSGISRSPSQGANQ